MLTGTPASVAHLPAEDARFDADRLPDMILSATLLKRSAASADPGGRFIVAIGNVTEIG